MLGAAASEAAKALSHSLTLAVNLAVLSNLAQATWHRTKRAGPTLALCLAMVLVCADPLRHVLQDSGVWPSSSSHMYQPQDEASVCDSSDVCRAPISEGGYGHHAPWVCSTTSSHCVCPEASLRCLSRVGVVFLLCTYSGFVCLAAGVLAGANLPQKMWLLWRRGRRAARD